MSGESADTLVFDEDTERKIAYGSAGVTVLGSLLPWYTFFGATILGIDTEGGILTLIVGVAVAAAVYFVDWEERTAIATAVAGGLVVLVSLLAFTGISSVGVYVTLLGGIGLLVAGQSGYRRL